MLKEAQGLAVSPMQDASLSECLCPQRFNGRAALNSYNVSTQLDLEFSLLRGATTWTLRTKPLREDQILRPFQIRQRFHLYRVKSGASRRSYGGLQGDVGRCSSTASSSSSSLDMYSATWLHLGWRIPNGHSATGCSLLARCARI